MLLMTRDGLKKFNEATGKNLTVDFGSSWLVNHDENKNLINDLDEGGEEDDSDGSVQGEDIPEHDTDSLEHESESET